MHLAVGLAVAAATVVPSSEARASDTVTRWEQFSEASSCGEPYTKTPYATKKGTLSDAQIIPGPFGTYFGRTVGEVRSKLVWWDVPYSGGRRVLVHQSAKPAFDRVAAGLASEAAQGRVYPIQSAATFVPRTIGGSYQMSRHTLGIAIDMNPPQNPYRSDNQLITDMPDWFVDVWRDAGFCWGGDWVYSKDAMHFSWMGPGAGAGSYPAMDPIAPSTSKQDLGSEVDSAVSALAPVLNRYEVMLGDGTGNAAPDVVGLRSAPDGSVLDVASSTGHYGECSVARWHIPDNAIRDGNFTLLLDIDGDSRSDLVTLHQEGDEMVARIATSREEFANVTRRTTALPTDMVAVAGADFDDDHLGDLVAVAADGTVRVFSGPDWQQITLTGSLPSGPPRLLAAGDRDGGDTPEIFALYESGQSSRVEVLHFDTNWAIDHSAGLPLSADRYLAVSALDFDGDGRSDFQLLDDTGRFSAYVANTSTGRTATGWFVRPDPDPCDEPVDLTLEAIFPEWGEQADEMFFYRNDGLYRFYDVGGDARLGNPIKAGSDYESGWDTIVAIDLDGGGRDELFFYRRDGHYQFYDVGSNGDLVEQIRAGDEFTSNWDSITAIDLDGDRQDEMFFYRSDGLYRYYDIRPDGTLGSPIRSGSEYTRGWDSISAIDLDGDGQDEMFFYREDGLYRYYDIRPNGTIPKPMQAGDEYTRGWSSITAIDLDGDGQDEAFFYRDDGLYRYYDIRPDGTIPKPILAGSEYTAGWSAITAIDLD